tara:strand:- start:583 stop:933 length:351 start_codon:yes stop_codon:yes gene_type:complete
MKLLSKLSLLKLSLAISLLGIFTLLLLANTLQPKLTTIDQLTTKQLNKQIALKGKITNIKNYETFQILTLDDTTGKIDLLINQITDYTKNQQIIITGTLSQYKENLQVQILSIKPI